MVRRALAVIAAGLVVAGAAVAADSLRTVEANGVSLRLTDDWLRVARAEERATANPRTLIVAGTHGVHAIDTDCQVATYRIPSDGAAVVVIGWRRRVGTSYLPGKEALVAKELERGYFECFDGRGVAVQLELQGHTYQLNVMVGDRADRGTITDALAAARSFALAD
jgi:hypothetical protein